MYLPKHTFESVVNELVEGLEAGEIRLQAQQPDQFAEREVTDEPAERAAEVRQRLVPPEKKLPQS